MVLFPYNIIQYYIIRAPALKPTGHYWGVKGYTYYLGGLRGRSPP